MCPTVKLSCKSGILLAFAFLFFFYAFAILSLHGEHDVHGECVFAWVCIMSVLAVRVHGEYVFP